MLRNMSDVKNYAIGATDGDIGQVDDFYFDDRTWVIRYLVIDTGSWLAGRKVLISPIAIHAPNWEQGILPVSITKEQVRQSPEIETERPVSRQNEMRYFDYYGYPIYWGGSGLWGECMYPNLMYPGKANTDFVKTEKARHCDDDRNLRSCNAVIGYHVHATDGDIGHIQDLLVDEATWAIRYFVVNTSNWWLGHNVLIAPGSIKDMSWSGQSASVDLTRESIKESPPYHSTEQLNRELESCL